jgi:hypothetical protein
MENNLLYDNNLDLYVILIGSGLILGCSLYYLIISNKTAVPTKNMEMEPFTFTDEEIEAILSENANTTAISNADIDIEEFLTDSDFDTESDYHNISDYDSASTADFDEILQDPDLFFMPPFESKFKNVEFIMPDVDLNVCPIEELKLFEFCSLFGKEMAEHSITEEDMMEIICLFQKEELATN